MSKEIKCPYGYSIVDNFIHKEFECGLKSKHLEQIEQLQAQLNEAEEGLRLMDETEKQLQAENKKYRAVLEILARLGNGQEYGNSDGNILAQQALRNRL